LTLCFPEHYILAGEMFALGGISLNLRPLFYPESLAIFGLSSKPNNLGKMILDNLLQWGYSGKVCGVNPSGDSEVAGTPVYANLEQVPYKVDLAVIITPARFVPDVLEQCGQRGICFAVIETGGFSELGPEGAALAIVVKEKAERHGIRFVGPNGLGIVNAEIRLALPFSHVTPWECGGISVVSQSGGVGLTLIYSLQELQLRPNKFVSIGNKYSLDETDYLNSCLKIQAPI
jgi:acetate---CoA ligase (ADP-forming)